MAERLPQSVAFRVVFKAFLASNKATIATGKTIAMVLSKNGGAFANPSGGATNAVEMSQGWYYVDLSTTDTGTLGPLIVRGTQAQIDPAEALYTVVNAHHGGFDALPNAAAEASGGLFTRGTGAGQINQDAAGRVDTRWVTGSVTVATNNDKTDYGLSSSERSTLTAAIWAVLTSTLTTAGSIGKLLVDQLDAAISSRSTYAGSDTAGTTTLLTRLTSTRAGNLDNLNAAITTRAVAGDAMTLTSAYDPAKTAAQAGDAMTLTSGERSSIATAVWSYGTRALTSFGTLVGDIWDVVVDSSGVTTLLARLTSTRAGLLDHLDADVSTRLASAGYTAPDNATITDIDAALDAFIASYEAPDNATINDIDITTLAIQAKTDNLPVDPTGVTDLANLDVAVSTRLAADDYVPGGGGSVDLDGVKAVVVEALDEDTYGPIGQEDLPTTVSLTYMLRWLYKLNRNRGAQTNDTFRLYNNAETTVDQKATVTQDASVAVRGRFETGP